MKDLNDCTDMTEKMLRSYPDYGKSPPEYAAGIAGVLSMLSPEIRQEIFDPMRGIRSRCKFLPTIADIVELADQISARIAARKDFKERYGRGYTVVETARKPFIPFPELWEAFKDEPEVLYGRDFGTYQDAFKALCLPSPYGGKAMARSVMIDRGYNEFVKRHGVPTEYVIKRPPATATTGA